MPNLDVVVYMRYITLDVALPKDIAFKFMEEFGREFAKKDVMEGHAPIHSVDRYFEFPTSFHVVVSVIHTEEEELRAFLKAFCEKEKLSVRLDDPFAEHTRRRASV